MWKDAAHTLDEYLQFHDWKVVDEDPFYDWRLVKKVVMLYSHRRQRFAFNTSILLGPPLAEDFEGEE